MTLAKTIWISVLLLAEFLLFFAGSQDRSRIKAAVNEPIGCPQLPALTGDVMTSTGSCATTGPWHKISTQTASNAASMAWTGLGSTYNDYFINCDGVYSVAGGAVKGYIQLGEGSTPTWETASYTYSQVQGEGDNTTVLAVSSAGTDAGWDFTLGTLPNAVTKAVSVRGTIHGMLSTTYYTTAEYLLTVSGTTTSYGAAAHGRYNGDTNPKTAIRVIVSSGNINGACSLWAWVLPP